MIKSLALIWLFATEIVALDKVLFIGGSWAERADKAVFEASCENSVMAKEGYGGTTVEQWLTFEDGAFLDEVLEKHKDAASVFVAMGGNDLIRSKCEKSPSAVAQDTRTVVSRIVQALPTARVLLQPLGRSPCDRVGQNSTCGFGPFLEYASELQAIANDFATVHYVDTVFIAGGSLEETSDAAYWEDCIHLNDDGYGLLWSDPEVHSVLCPSADPPPDKVLFLGDSWAQSAQSSTFEAICTNSFVVNEGVGGSTASSWSNAQNGAFLDGILQANLDAASVWVTVGGGDLVSSDCETTAISIANDTSAIVDRVVEFLPRANVLLTPYARFPCQSNAACTMEPFSIYASRLEAIASAHPTVHYVDTLYVTGGSMDEPPSNEYWRDCLHLNDQGYQLFWGDENVQEAICPSVTVVGTSAPTDPNPTDAPTEPGSAAPADKVLVFGDSWAKRAQPVVFEASCENSVLVNEGMGGTTSEDWRKGESGTSLDGILNANSDASSVWISVGGNDLLQSDCAKDPSLIAEDTRFIIETVLDSLAEAKVLIIPYSRFHCTEMSTPCGVSPFLEYASHLESIASEHARVNYVDTMYLMGGSLNETSKPEYWADCIHLNDVGYERLWSQAEVHEAICPSFDPSGARGVVGIFLAAIVSVAGMVWLASC